MRSSRSKEPRWERRPTQPDYPDLRSSAIRAGIFHAQAGNVSERVGYIARGGLIEQFRREYVDDGRRFGTLGGLTVCRDDDLFHDRRGAQLEVEPGLLSGDDGDGLFLPVVTDGRGDGRNRSAFGQTREGIESGWKASIRRFCSTAAPYSARWQRSTVSNNCRPAWSTGSR